MIRNEPPDAEALDAALAGGATLPGSWYVDAEQFRREQELIMGRTWQYVGRTDQVGAPGDFFTCKIGAVPLVVVCEAPGALRALVNVCGHRGSELVLCDAGNRRTLQCHYHGWTYNLDGTLRAAPRSAEQPSFDPAAFTLRQVRLDTFGPFIFANLDPQAPPLSAFLGQLPALMRDAGAALDGLKPRGGRVYDMACNWKIVVENYLECYHCAIAHPGFAELIDLNRYEVLPYEYFSLQRGPAKNAPEENRLYDASGGPQEGLYAYLWPNFMLNIYPGRGNASLNFIVPVAPDRTLAIYEFYFGDEMPQSESDSIVAFIEQVQQEDIVLCESVQRGLASGYFRQGQLMLSRENGIQHFQRLVFEAMRAG